MPTVVSHAIAAAAVGSLVRGPLPTRFWVGTAVCAMAPDADVIGFVFAVRYGDLLGHRGLSHSLLVAASAGILVARLLTSGGSDLKVRPFSSLATYFALVTASHGILDAFTNGGLGVAFFAPFDATRYFFPWRPIQVSPIGPSFFSARGWDVVLSEMRWIWLPSAVLAAVGMLGRRRSASRKPRRKLGEDR